MEGSRPMTSRPALPAVTRTARRIGRRLRRLLRVRPTLRPRPHYRPYVFPVDIASGPCVGCGRPALVTVTVYDAITAQYCPARWHAIKALIEARGDRLARTPAARVAVRAARRHRRHPPCPG